MDKKKEILEKFESLVAGKDGAALINAREDFKKFFDQALTEVWNMAIDEAEKEISKMKIKPGYNGYYGTTQMDTIDAFVNQKIEEIRNNLRKLKV